MIVHGTRHRGEKINGAKLMKIEVERIKEALLFGAPVKSLAGIYGVHRITIHDIKCRRTWAHL